MATVFYISGGVALLATLLVIARNHAVHSLLYLIVALLATAVMLFALGAPLAAALEVIVYAGAILVLFVFVIMTLNLPPRGGGRQWMSWKTWIGPAVLCGVLLAELLPLIRGAPPVMAGSSQAPVQVGAAMFGPYVLAVELASMLLLSALVGACHLARHKPPQDAQAHKEDGQ